MIANRNAREIATLVPMRELLAILGFVVNERTHRAPCSLHAGQNPTAFSWHEDGRWFCFSCQRGGDKITLVQAVRRCGFREGITFLACLAGVEFCGEKTSPARVRDVHRRRRLLALASRVREVVRSTERDARETVQSLAAIRRSAGQRLDALRNGAPARWPGEAELAWSALKFVADHELGAHGAYLCAVLAATSDRIRFALGSTEEREVMVSAAIEAGIVKARRGRIEVRA